MLVIVAVYFGLIIMSHLQSFIDEIHRFNKAQQDAFLPFVEQVALP